MEKYIPTLFIFMGILLCLIGFAVIFFTSIAPVTGAGGNISTGGIIFIGPFPIVFGSGKYSLQLIWLSIIILILMLIISYAFFKGYSKGGNVTF